MIFMYNIKQEVQLVKRSLPGGVTPRNFTPALNQLICLQMPLKKSPALTSWNFTYQETVNNQVPPADCITNVLRDLDATHYAFQMEMGKKSKRLHWQGNVKFKRPITGPNLRKAFKAGVRQGSQDEWIYWGGGCLTTTPTHNVDASNVYCLKDETRVDGYPREFYPENFYLGKDLKDYESMFPWQRAISSIVLDQEPDERAIHLVVDPIGGAGKSTLSKG